MYDKTFLRVKAKSWFSVLGGQTVIPNPWIRIEIEIEKLKYCYYKLVAHNILFASSHRLSLASTQPTFLVQTQPTPLPSHTFLPLIPLL